VPRASKDTPLSARKQMISIRRSSARNCRTEL
jgi:hypothetical protein